MTSNESNCDLWNFLNSISQQLEALLEIDPDDLDAWRSQGYAQSEEAALVSAPAFMAPKQLHEKAKLHSRERPADASCPMVMVAPPAQQVSQIAPHNQEYYQPTGGYGFQQPTTNLPANSVQFEPANYQQREFKGPFDCAYCEWLARASANQPYERSSISLLDTNQIYAYLNMNNGHR